MMMVYNRLINKKPLTFVHFKMISPISWSWRCLLLFTEAPVKLSCCKKTDGLIQNLVGEAVTLELEVSRESAEVCWMKDGVRLSQSSNVTVIMDGCVRKLILHSAALADTGLYTCDAIDDMMEFPVKIIGMPKLHITRFNAQSTGSSLWKMSKKVLI